MARSPKRIVAAGYDRVARRYAELEHPDKPWPRVRWLRELLDRVPEGGEIVDIGCGNGVPALRAIAERHRATGVELSAVQVELARNNVPAAHVLHGDAMSVVPGRCFDGATAFYVLEHLPRGEHAAFFARVAEWLRPGGLFVFTVEPDEAPEVVGEWLGEPMFFSHFDGDTTLALVVEAGFEIERTALEAQIEGDDEITYLWVACRKPEA
jgi:cyclopropane fatty-acyl-phospholipid synthase-like methyltransferase